MTDKRMTVVGYVRVSTENQLENYSIEEQTERLKSYCKAKGWSMVKIYTDGGYSGGNIDRPALQQLLRDIKTSNIDAVLVYKLDRLSRSQKDTLALIEDKFLNNKIDFISVNENFDTSTPFGKAMIGILSVFAQLEKDQITERFTMGRIGRGKAGYFHGGGNPPFGYQYINGGLILLEHEALQIKDIFNKFLMGKSINAICNEMQNIYGGSWTAAKVRNILLNSIYIGKIKFAGVEYQGRHEPVISDEIFAETQRLLHSVQRGSGKNAAQKTPFRANFLLSSLIYCDRCGSRYAGNHGYYKCYSRAKNSPKFITDPNCDNNHWDIKELDGIIIQAICDLFQNQNLADDIVNSTPETETKKEPVHKKKENISRQIHRLIELYQVGAVPIEDITQRINALELEKKRLENRLNENHFEHVNKKDSFLCTFENFRENFDSAPLETQRLLVSNLIQAIRLDGDNVSIVWRI